MKPEDRKRLKKHIEMIVEHKFTEGDMGDKDKELRGMVYQPENIDKATAIYDAIISSVGYKKTFSTMSNAGLADALMRRVWAELPMFSENSELIEEIVERLNYERT